MKSACVITGASSQIGDVLLPKLQGVFASLVAWSRQPFTGEGQAVSWQCQDLEADYELDAEVTHVVHLAPLYLLAPLLAKAQRPLRVVGISTCSVIHKAQSSSLAERELAARFLAAEQKVIKLAQQQGHELTLLRPTMLYGLGRDGTVAVLQKFACRFGFLLVPGNADGLRQPVHVEDIAQAVVQCLNTKATIGKTYELGGRSVLSLRELCAKILLDNGRRPRVFSIPLWMLKLAIYGARLSKLRPDWDVGLLQRAQQNQTVDYGKAQRDFGYDPMGFQGRVE